MTPFVRGIAVVGDSALPESREWLDVAKDGRAHPHDIVLHDGEYMLVTAIEPGRIEVIRDILPKDWPADPDGWVGVLCFSEADGFHNPQTGTRSARR